MKQRFQVHQDGVLTVSQKVLKVKVGCLQYVQNRQVLALPFIKPNHFFSGPAARRLHKLYPSMVFTIQDLQFAELRIGALLIHPLDEILEMSVYSHRSRFVDQLRSIFESRNDHGPALTVRVSCAGRSFHQDGALRIKIEEPCYLWPIRSQVLQ